MLRMFGPHASSKDTSSDGQGWLLKERSLPEYLVH